MPQRENFDDPVAEVNRIIEVVLNSGKEDPADGATDVRNVLARVRELFDEIERRLEFL